VSGGECIQSVAEPFGRSRRLCGGKSFERRERGVDREFARDVRSAVVRGAREVVPGLLRVGVAVREQRGSVRVDAAGDVLRESLRGERGVEYADRVAVAGEHGSGFDGETGRARAAGDADERGGSWLHASSFVSFSY
jgi:hypothetical protein